MQAEKKQKLLDYLEGFNELKSKFPIGAIIAEKEEVSEVVEIAKQAGFGFIENKGSALEIEQELRRLFEQGDNIAIVVKNGKYILNKQDIEKQSQSKSRIILIFSQQEYNDAVSVAEIITSYCKLIS